MRRIIVAGAVLGLVAIGIALWRRFDVAHSQELVHNAEVVRVTRRDIGTAVKATEAHQADDRCRSPTLDRASPVW